jgi:mono/diheme cytochrome c family protein
MAALAALVLALAVAALPVPAWAQAGDANAGKVVYERRCALCHGLKGDGKGPAAELLSPPPRDFTTGVYKIRTTSNKTPSDQDLFKIITDGMPGTSMPPWKVLPEKDRWNLVAYLKTFGSRSSVARRCSRPSSATSATAPRDAPTGRRVPS